MDGAAGEVTRMQKATHDAVAKHADFAAAVNEAQQEFDTVFCEKEQNEVQDDTVHWPRRNDANGHALCQRHRDGRCAESERPDAGRFVCDVGRSREIIQRKRIKEEIDPTQIRIDATTR